MISLVQNAILSLYSEMATMARFPRSHRHDQRLGEINLLFPSRSLDVRTLNKTRLACTLNAS